MKTLTSISMQCFLYLIHLFWIISRADSLDPCDSNNHKPFPGVMFGSRNEKCPPPASSLCDYNLEEDWYVVEKASLTNHCPKPGSCGVAYPAWINGTFPMVSEGILNMTACINADDDCCNSNVSIMVKNCTQFNVYFFSALPFCASAYCFESSLPCVEPTTTTHSTSTNLSPNTTGQMTTNESSSSSLGLGIGIGVGVTLVLCTLVLVGMFMKGGFNSNRVTSSVAVNPIKQPAIGDDQIAPVSHSLPNKNIQPPPYSKLP